MDQRGEDLKAAGTLMSPPTFPPRGTKITGSNMIPLGQPKTFAVAEVRPPRGTKITGSNMVPLGQPRASTAALAEPHPVPNRGPQDTSVSYVRAKPVLPRKRAAAVAGGGGNASTVSSKQWPPSLKDYVTRVFQECPKASRTELQTALKRIIQGVSARGDLWTVDWEGAPTGAAEIIAGAAPSELGGGVQAFSATPAEGKTHRGRKKGKRRARNDPSQGFRNANETDFDHEEFSKRARRAGRFGQGNADGAVAKGRAGRHRAGYGSDLTSFNSSGVQRGRSTALQLALAAEEGDGEIDWDAFAVKGTCKSLEKSYFRLTSAPDPSTVRPQPVLEDALQRLLERMEAGKENYFYAQDQLKAIRQDCTVQHIRNAFTVQVYETHGRLALRYGELADYNQCQTQLINLYRDGLNGDGGEECEFLAYRVLYQTFQGTSGGGEMLKTLQRAAAFRSDPQVRRALAIRRAVLSGDYISFFALRGAAPELIRSLMEVHVEKMRFESLECICRAYLPSIPLLAAAKALGFGEDVNACSQWLEARGAQLSEDDPVVLDTKASRGQLFVPEDDTKVAHGDRNLAIDDFLARVAAD